MIRKGILTITFLCTFFVSFGKGGLLDIAISVEINNTEIGKILKLIETKAHVSFSYSLELIDDKKIVSLNIQEKTIRYGLSLIFDQSIRFKEVGHHIILLRNDDKELAKACKKEKVKYEFVGKVTDKRTGNPIAGASIYEVEGRYAALTNEKGEYKLIVPGNCSLTSIYFKKKGYSAEVAVVNGAESTSIRTNMALEPIEQDVANVSMTDVQPIEQNINERAISGSLVSSETYQHGQNLDEINEKRLAQISLVPSVSIGSNLSTNALITNQISLNVLAGFSGGVEGVEIGGIANMVKGDVTGAQGGGIVNLVGGDVLGVQFGGISNLVQGNVTGVQVSGISGIMKRDLLGLQLSGVASIVRGGFRGVQIGGVGNIAFNKSYGAQISGVFNIVKDSLNGGQVSGIANLSNGGTNVLQISGISNFANRNNGLQVTGIQNFARENNGLQIGLFNSSLRGKGIAIGLFNFVKEGYHKTEIAANEIFPINLTFKTGTQRLYNIYNFGVKFGPNRAYAGGLGFGTYFNLSEKLMLSIDATAQMVFENDFEKFEFTQLNKLSTTVDFKLGKRITLFGGPSLNVNLVQFAGDSGNYETNISFLPMLDKQGASSRQIMWIGGQLGIRL